jgi:DUF4097 and DUF4098 domain-containing protein YvlB
MHPTKHHRLTAFVMVAILAAAIVAGCDSGSGSSATTDRTFTVSGPVRLELENGDGDSRVVVGAPGEVRVHAEFRAHGWAFDDPDRKLKEIVANPPFSQDGSLIRIGHSGWDMNSISAEYTVTVPPDTEMHGSSGSGNLDVNGIAGPAAFTVGSGNISATAIGNDTRAVAGSGHVSVTDSQGRVEVTNGSGEVLVRGAKNEVRVHTGSGDIRVEQPGANLVVETGSGDVDVTGATADVRMHTSSGDINLNGNPRPSSYWDIRASSGDVKLEVPSSASFRFHGHTGSGDFDVTIPHVTEGSSGNHVFQARVGDGQARVEVETSSGDISVH